MNATHKQAAKESKDGAARFVVYVPDQGSDVYTKEQCATWASLIFIEATYLNGVKVAA